MLSRFELRLLGTPALRVGGEKVALSPLQWAIVGYLFGGDSPTVLRSHLLPLLWAHGSERVLRRRLSQATYALNRRVGESILAGSTSSLRAEVERVDVDLAAYRKAIRRETFDDAAGILRRGFLSGLPEVPTRDFERWIERRTASLRAELREAAMRRWSRAEREGLWTQKTLEASRALLLLSPADEGALRRAVWAEALVSSPMEAMATFESFLEINKRAGLDEVEPDTQTLLERVRALSKRPRSLGFGRPTPSRADPTLYGRDAELGRLRPLLSGAVQDGLTVVQVVGAAGLGKSRLIRECLGPSALQGRRVLSAQLAELERDIPMNAIIEAFSTQEIARALGPLDEPWRSLLLHLMPEFTAVVGPAKAIPAVQPASLQRRLLEAVRLLIQRVLEDQPLVVFLDDFHWVDASSLAALEYLRRRWCGGSAVLVVTVRPELVEADSKLRSFLDGDDIVRIELQELDDVSQKQLVREVAGGEVVPDALGSLQALGGGNPLYLIELTRQWQEGQLVLPERQSDQIPLPVSIQQLYEHRFRGLRPPAVRMLEALAVWGKRLSVSDAAAVAGVSLREATTGIEELDRMGLLRWTGGGVEFWHGLIRQAALAKTGEARRRLLHRQAADFLVSLGDPDLDELALHRDRAGQRRSAFDYSLRVADQAETVGALSEAVRFSEIAARNATVDDRPSVLRRLADLFYRQCRFEEAGQAFGELLTDLDVSRLSESDLITRVRTLDCDAFRDPGFSEAMARNYRVLWDAAVAGQHWEAAAWASTSAVHYLQRAQRFGDVEHWLADIQLCIRYGNERAQCVAHQLGIFFLMFGDTNRAREHCRRAVALARRSGVGDQIARALGARLVFFIFSGRLATAKGMRLQRIVLREARNAGDVLSTFRACNNIGSFYLDIGELEKSKQFLDRARALYSAVDVQPEGVRLTMNEAELALANHDYIGARSRFRASLPENASINWYGWEAAVAGLGLCALGMGSMGKAVKHFERLSSQKPSRLSLPGEVSLVATFLAKTLWLQRDFTCAHEVLDGAAEKLGDVHLPQWLKVRLEKLRLLRREGRDISLAALKEADRCTALALSPLARRFRALAS